MAMASKGKMQNTSVSSKFAVAISAFLFGCILSTMVVLNYVAVANTPSTIDQVNMVYSNGLLAPMPNPSAKRRVVDIGQELDSAAEPEEPLNQPGVRRVVELKSHDVEGAAEIFINEDPSVIAAPPDSLSVESTKNPLHGIRVLIAIAAFDFSQIPHLGEVLDAYQDLCVTGAKKSRRCGARNGGLPGHTHRSAEQPVASGLPEYLFDHDSSQTEPYEAAPGRLPQGTLL